MPEYILQKIRQARRLKRDDDIFDKRIRDDSAMQRLRDVASWELGDSVWADRFVAWAIDCGFEIVEPTQKNPEMDFATN
jgi:hypothetical protein